MRVGLGGTELQLAAEDGVEARHDLATICAAGVHDIRFVELSELSVDVKQKRR